MIILVICFQCAPRKHRRYEDKGKECDVTAPATRCKMKTEMINKFGGKSEKP